MAQPIRVAVFGCGFWSRFQIAAWRELEGVEISAVYNRTRAKAQAMADEFGIKGVFDDPQLLLDSVPVDAVDIITDVDTHKSFVEMALNRGKSVICQKPMASNIRDCQAAVDTCAKRGIPFYIHENWRHQTPIRELKRVLLEDQIGEVFRARVDFHSAFPVFTNQPFLRTLPQFILTDIGSHIFDAARFLFGEATSICCKTQKIHSDIAGEDVATALLDMGDLSVTCNMAYAENPHEHDCFPQTFVFVEGAKGTAYLGPDYALHVTTAAGTHSWQARPPRFAWADPAYDLVHSSIVSCNRDLLAGLRGKATPETTGHDNLKTMRLVYGAYASARLARIIDPSADDWFDASLP